MRAFLAVRDWPWWRLLVRVTPLLNVHRTEEQLKIANDELATLRAKLEKIEADRSTLKNENCRLESKVSAETVCLSIIIYIVGLERECQYFLIKSHFPAPLKHF